MQQRGAGLLEVIELHRAPADPDQQHAAADFLGGILCLAEQGVEAGHQWLHMGSQQPARVEIGQQVLHGQQGVDFLRGEPQPRQRELAAGLGGKRLEAIPAGVAVEDDRGVEAVAQVLEIALQRGPRNFAGLLQLPESDQAAVLQQLLDLVKALGTIHGHAPGCLRHHGMRPGGGQRPATRDGGAIGAGRRARFFGISAVGLIW